MIWLVLILLVIVAGAYLLQPFLGPSDDVAESALDEARKQRATVDLDEKEGRLSEHAAHEARDALDRRILALIEAVEPSEGPATAKSMALFIVPAVLLLGGVGLYAQIGNPSFEPITFAEYQAEQAAQLPDTLDALVVELKARLDADPNPPVEGFVLLARSYLRLGDAEAALETYDTAIARSGGDSALVAERDRVLEILQSRPVAPAIDPEARARIEAMTPDEQAAMIENMVEGLAVRLEQDPTDFEGWMRLIRARAVMSDVDQARRDLARAHETFSPETDQGQALSRLAAQLLPPEPESDQD